MAELWQRFLDAPDYFQESPWFPNPAICVRDMAITGSREVINRLPWDGVGEWLNGTWFLISRVKYNDPSAIYVPLLMAVFITLIRVLLTWMVFKHIPKWLDFSADAAEKFPESIFKAIFYTTTWVWAVYLVTSGKHNSFFNLRSHWDTWDPTSDLGPGIYWLYMTQMGFYLHCMYASVYLEVIRRDYAVMLTHHVLTTGLLLFSYIIRFHAIGLLLLCLLDVGDISLETSKVFVYFKDRGGRGRLGDKKNPVLEMIANICFGIFTLQHMVFRLYWFPTKVIYSAMHVSVNVVPEGPYYLLFIPMMWALYVMQVYWFKFILRLLWKIFVLGQKDIEDSREYEEAEARKAASLKKSKEE